MKRDDTVFLSHILESIELIEKYLDGITENEFFNSLQAQDAVIRRFEIIGEATKNVSQATRTTYSEVPWKVMAGMRDMLIHEYFGVDLEEVWSTCINDLPELKQQIKDVLKKYKKLIK